VFATRLVECQQLSFEDFKAESLCDLSFYDMGGFAQRAALFIFVEPTQLAECQRWFVESINLWKECMAAKGKKLIDPVRYLWQNGTLNEVIRSNFTLYALSHVDDDSRAALCQALSNENPENKWIRDNLPKAPDVASELPCGNAKSSTLPKVGSGPSSKDAEPHMHLGKEKEKAPQPVVASPEAVPLEKWYTVGEHSECRFCGFRPSYMKIISQIIRKTMRYVYPWFRFCGSCEYKTMKFGLAKDEAARENITIDKRNKAT
jgi:hypothetical protein